VKKSFLKTLLKPGKPKLDVDEDLRLKRFALRIKKLVKKWEPILGVHVKEAHLQPLKLYWASANEAAQRITFNTKLVDMSPAYVEVTVVHEMVHFLTDGHDQKFFEMMDRHVPNWRKLHERYAEPLTRDS
jgi:predicted metal-dependent hydrolase